MVSLPDSTVRLAPLGRALSAPSDCLRGPVSRVRKAAMRALWTRARGWNLFAKNVRLGQSSVGTRSANSRYFGQIKVVPAAVEGVSPRCIVKHVLYQQEMALGVCLVIMLRLHNADGPAPAA